MGEELESGAKVPTEKDSRLSSRQLSIQAVAGGELRRSSLLFAPEPVLDQKRIREGDNTEVTVDNIILAGTRMLLHSSAGRI